MSKILDFPKVVAYAIKDAFHLEQSKIVQISDYQKDHKGADHNHLLSYPKKSSSQIIDDEDDDEEILEEDCVDRRSTADKAIYFSSFISF